ncbi:trifunctional dihydropteroate synthetase/dihydrohydroxymethylpterin pyrophosphokinase/dihydroneopterin aldolase [Martiniozyma asiatica (nom. inval.)]|nr:trifunctional dihydropteroate synthetase/dihydrohydroxymethylpterin pyrophosphokinase/dihydroneopterin aldolase [Martiniozyma asiatica]
MALRRLSDCVSVKDLQFLAGVESCKKNLLLSANLATNFSLAADTDDLKHSINYAVLARKFKVFEEENKNKNFKSFQSLAKNLFSNVVFQSNCESATLMIKSRESNFDFITTMNRAWKDGQLINNNKYKDRLSVSNLSLDVIIGVFTFERFQKQPVMLNVDMEIDLDFAKVNSLVGHKITEYVENTNFKTVEALVLNVTKLVYNLIPDVKNCNVSVLKTDIIDYTDVGVSCERTKEEAQLLDLKPVQFEKSDITTDKFVIPNLNDETKALFTNKDITVYLSFGSNQGQQLKNINQAINELNAHSSIKVIQTSSLYKSKPMYYLDQADFINGCIKIKTSLEPVELLKVLKNIEYGSLHRVKDFDNGPRVIDLDIILYDSLIVNTPNLNIPHIRMLERSFVLVPLCELLPPNFIHPVTSEPIHDHLHQLKLSTPSTEIQESSDLITLIPLASSDTQFNYIEFDLVHNKSKTQLMSILNVTPDSFSDGSENNLSLDVIMKKVKEMVESKVDIIDIGGCSTRPGSEQPDENAEISRVIPVIKSIKEKYKNNVLISVDTYRSKVAEEAIKAGADIVNDISAGLFDDKMYSVIAKYEVPYIIGHTRGNIQTMNSLTNYSKTNDGNLKIFNDRECDEDYAIIELGKELAKLVENMYANGIKRWQLIIDPGLGFAKQLKENLIIIRKLPLFKQYKHYNEQTENYVSFDYIPVLLGPSRKKFIGTITGKETASDRVNGTSASITAGIGFGSDIVRVHDFKEMKDVCLMGDAIYKGIH